MQPILLCYVMLLAPAARRKYLPVATITQNTFNNLPGNAEPPLQHL